MSSQNWGFLTPYPLLVVFSLSKIVPIFATPQPLLPWDDIVYGRPLTNSNYVCIYLKLFFILASKYGLVKTLRGFQAFLFIMMHNILGSLRSLTICLEMRLLRLLFTQCKFLWISVQFLEKQYQFFIYRTLAIISRGLSIFTPLFSAVYNQELLILQTIFVLKKESWA